MKTSLFIMILLLLCSYSSLSGQQRFISGKISQDTEWNGKINITDDITILPGVTLTIRPGTELSFTPISILRKSDIHSNGIEIIVAGRILAIGHEHAPIIFTSAAKNPRMHDWYGLICKPNQGKESKFKNCVFEYSYTAITCYGVSPKIENCIIRYNYMTGISCQVRAHPYIYSSMIMGNGFSGISCELQSHPVIANCIISENVNGIIAYDRSQPNLGKKGSASPQSLGENYIFNNFEYDIYNHSEKDLYAQNNFWNTKNKKEVNQRIYDRTENKKFGNVIFTPFGKRYKKRLAQKKSQPRQKKSQRHKRSSRTANASKPLSRRPSDSLTQSVLPVSNKESLNSGTISLKQQKFPIDTPLTNETELTPEALAALSGLTSPKSKSSSITYSATSKSPPATDSTTLSIASLILPPFSLSPLQENQPPQAPQKTSEFRELKEPILESFLDGGKRRYLKISRPKYPKIYLLTRKEGVVLIEAIIEKNGLISRYKILRSDGKAFSEAAIQALKKYRYQTGTFKGKAISFKVVERFKFKIK